MRRAMGVAVLAAVLAVAGGGPVSGATRKAPPRPAMATYEWHNAGVLPTAENRRRLKFMRANGFGTVYLELGEYLDAADRPDGPDRRKRLDAIRAKIRRFVATASGLGLTVHAVGGGPTWVGELGYLGRMLVELVGAYNASVRTPERLRGVQLDIEPYVVDPGFVEGDQDSFGGYLATLFSIVKAYRVVRSKWPNRGLQLGFAIPFWFDAEEGAPGPVLFDGALKPAAHHIVDMVSSLPHAYLVVMSYRNFTQGPDGSIAHARGELRYARAVGARCGLVVGQQYADVQPAYITFHRHSRRAFRRAADDITRAFWRYPQFRGLSVDDLDSFMAARP
jgi:hypothetical protein